MGGKKKIEWKIQRENQKYTNHLFQGTVLNDLYNIKKQIVIVLARILFVIELEDFVKTFWNVQIQDSFTTRSQVFYKQKTFKIRDQISAAIFAINTAVSFPIYLSIVCKLQNNFQIRLGYRIKHIQTNALEQACLRLFCLNLIKNKSNYSLLKKANNCLKKQSLHVYIRVKQDMEQAYFYRRFGVRVFYSAFQVRV
eukprot:TRINITY_DN14057_c0_g1_i3.p1 TRINITY_DN14057_c0_g1~~TRINITY_DN14057_c0_g1_i3.p1  ORF type:complete len:204 (-),score=-12.80 TRINITY_DN14057_c0_g1_i3:484-1071(-)